MPIRLSILIPSTHDRQPLLDGLLLSLNKQITDLGVEGSVEIITSIDNREATVGFKRNQLIHQAEGEYVVFIDSDDEVTYDYISEVLKATHLEPDVITFNGYMTHSGSNRENFKIAQGLPYITIKDANGKNEYLRFPNHLCPVKKSVAIQIGYRDLKFAEDYDYALRLKNSDLIKTSAYIEKDLYHYKYITNK